QTGAQIEPLAHPARIRAHQTVARVNKLQPFQHRRCGRSRPPTVEAEEPSGELEVLTAGHRRLHRRRLARQPDHAANAGRLTPNIDPRHIQLAAVGTDQGCNRADEGRLPRAVRAEQGGDLAGIGDEIETIQRRDLVATLAQPTSLDDRGHELTPWSCKAVISFLSERNRSTGGLGLHLYDKTERANVTGLPRLQFAELSSDLKSPTGPRCANLSGLTIAPML